MLNHPTSVFGRMFSFGLLTGVLALIGCPVIMKADQLPPQIGVSVNGMTITNNQTNAVDFGTALLNSSGTILIFTVTNSGVQSLNVGAISVPAGYILISNCPSTIAAGSSGTLSLQQTTLAVATNTGHLVIDNNDTNNNPFIIPVTGIVGTAIISMIGDLDFGVVPLDSSYWPQKPLPPGLGLSGFDLTDGPPGPVAYQTITISNGGTAPLTINGASLANWFSVLTGWYAVPYRSNYIWFFQNPTIAPYSAASLTIGIAPTSAAFYEDSFVIYSDATSGNNTLPISATMVNGPMTLSLNVFGNGTISPGSPPWAARAVDSYHTFTAQARANNLFAGWTGSITSTKPTISFVMKSAMLLQANFIPSPFIPFVGSYNGLFALTNSSVTPQTAGMLRNLTVNQYGLYSGALLIDGESYPLSGRFDLNLTASNHIDRAGSPGSPFTVTMKLSSNNPPQITGTVSGQDWQAGLIADQGIQPYQLGSYAVHYTVLIPPATNNPTTVSAPVGDSYALINIETLPLQITGALADGTTFSEASAISSAGNIPICADLYGGKGLLIGWINLISNNISRPGLTWIHPAHSAGIFPDGFTNIFSPDQILSSSWSANSDNTLLLTNLSIFTADTNRSENIPITISSTGQITGQSVNGVINPATGSLTITVDQGANRLTAHGAFLSSITNAAGYFITKTNAGGFNLNP